MVTASLVLDYLFSAASLLLPCPVHSGGVVIEEGFNLHCALWGCSGDRSEGDGFCVCVCLCMWRVSWYQKVKGNMQVWTSHYPVACVLSLIHCYWPHSHLCSFTLLILGLSYLTSLSLTHTYAHTHTNIESYRMLSIQADKASAYYNIYTSQLFLCAQLRKEEIVLQNTAYTLFTLLSLCLLYSPFLCSTAFWTWAW